MKKTVTTIVVLAFLAGLATLAVAGPPLPGVYKTTDMGGPVSTGRYTEGWDAGGGALLPGTTLDAESWNGSTLGTEWRYWCATTSAPGDLLTDTVDGSGNGSRTYRKVFVGGSIWLSGSGPWANGDADYPGTIDSYVEYETVHFFGGVEVNAVTNVQATAHFDAYPASCMTFYVSNGVRIGSTDLGGSLPPDYPGFLSAGACAPNMPNGAWWNMMTMTLSVTQGCATPVEASTWGAIKTLYR